MVTRHIPAWGRRPCRGITASSPFRYYLGTPDRLTTSSPSNHTKAGTREARHPHAYPLRATWHCQRPRRPNSGSTDIPVGAKTPNFLSITRPLWQKDAPSPPFITRFPRKTPVQTPPRPATLPPCSNPSPISTILPITQFQPAALARDSRPNVHFPTPRTSLPQIRSPARQYRSNRRQNPSLDPQSAPPPAPCPTGISGNERK